MSMGRGLPSSRLACYPRPTIADTFPGFSHSYHIHYGQSIPRHFSHCTAPNMPSSKGNPTDPELREKLKEEIKQQPNKSGGGEGQWAAWKVCLLTRSICLSLCLETALIRPLRQVSSQKSMRHRVVVMRMTLSPRTNPRRGLLSRRIDGFHVLFVGTVISNTRKLNSSNPHMILQCMSKVYICGRPSSCESYHSGPSLSHDVGAGGFHLMLQVSIEPGPPKGVMSTLSCSMSSNPHARYSGRPLSLPSMYTGKPSFAASSTTCCTSMRPAPRFWCFGSVWSMWRSCRSTISRRPLPQLQGVSAAETYRQQALQCTSTAADSQPLRQKVPHTPPCSPPAQNPEPSARVVGRGCRCDI